MEDMSPHLTEIASVSLRARRRISGLLAAAALLLSMSPRIESLEQQKTSPRGCSPAKAPMRAVSGKVAFITGGSSGIGLGIARAFSDAGMQVAIGYRTQQHIDQALKDFGTARNRIHAVKVDVTDRSEMESAAREVENVFGKLHVLVNNAGVAHFPGLTSTTYDDWDKVIATNVTGVFNGLRSFLPRIQAHGEGGQVITTSSILGLFSGGGGQGAYTASKFAVVGMMESLRAELASANIGVSIVCPGIVRTNLVNSGRDSVDRKHAVNDADADKGSAAARTGAAAAGKDSQLEMDAFEVGRRVLRGMCNNDLYILTHPEFGPIMRARSSTLLESLPRDSVPTTRLQLAKSLLEDSIYVRHHARTTACQ